MAGLLARHEAWVPGIKTYTGSWGAGGGSWGDSWGGRGGSRGRGWRTGIRGWLGMSLPCIGCILGLGGHGR